MPGEEIGRGGPADVVLLRDEGAERTPEEHVEHGPEGDVEPAVGAPEQDVPVPAHDRAHPQPREAGSIRRDDAHVGTSSSLSSAEVLDLVLGHDRAGQLEEHALEVAVPEGVGHIRGGAVGHDLTGGQEHDTLAEALHLHHVVARDEQRRAVVGGDLEQAGAHSVGDVGVEAGGRLVEHQELGVVEDRLHDPDEGALTRRQLHAHAVGQVGDLEALEPLLDRGLAGLPAHAVEAGEDRQGFAHPQPVRKGEVAGDEADLAHRRRAALGEGVPHDGDRAGVRGDGAEEHQERGGLAGSVGAEQGHALARADGEVHPVHGAHLRKGLHETVGFEHVPHRERSLAGSRGCRPRVSAAEGLTLG